ncbi:phage baseplate upper protein [Lentilactobacillus dabitei]|uniref:phage baseplate upper protein n=1 Tax=Lentilactobacillus dabitei TaxID=2831523 RepID=UPI00201C2BBA|nr:phage baseplate upper protein [Lentilactobacillus dabitei]
MSKELAFTDDNDVVKYLDTTTAFNLALTADGVAFDLTNAKSILVKIANDDGYIMQEAIDLTTVTSPLGGTLSFPINQNIMNTLVPDDYDIEVWVTMKDGTQAIFPSDGTLGFSIEENLMSDTGEVIPVITFDQFEDQFNDMMTQMQNTVSNVKKGDKGDTGTGLEIKDKVSSVSNLPSTANEGEGYLVGEELYVRVNNAWKDCGLLQGPKGDQGPQGIQGNTGTGISSTTIQYQISSSATTAPTGIWSNNIVATTTTNPYLWMKATLNYTDKTTKDFYLVSQKGDKGDTGATGPTGPIGPQGPVGSGLVVKGTVKEASQLPTTGNQEGYCYFIGTDLYVWDAGAWKNCGSVSPDLSKYVTVTDLNNGLSTKVNVTDTSNWQKQAMFNPGDYVIDATSSTIDFATLLRSKYNKPGVVYIRDNTSFVDAVIICEGNGWWHAYGAAGDGNFVHRLIRTTNDTGWVINADDSKVVHTTDTSSWQKQAMFNPGDFKIDTTSPTTDFATLLRSKYNKAGVVYIRDNTSFVDAVVICEGNGWWYAYGVKADGHFAYRKIRESDDTGWVINADDSKVAHLSGANNFDTVPTVNNKPLLLASSLPSDLARTTKDANFTGKLQKSGIDVATTTDVGKAVNTATANMANTTKPANFTAGLQKGGIDVATVNQLSAADDSGWIAFPSNSNLQLNAYYKIFNGVLYTMGTVGPKNSDGSPELMLNVQSIISDRGYNSLPKGIQYHHNYYRPQGGEYSLDFNNYYPGGISAGFGEGVNEFIGINLTIPIH